MDNQTYSISLVKMIIIIAFTVMITAFVIYVMMHQFTPERSSASSPSAAKSSAVSATSTEVTIPAEYLSAANIAVEPMTKGVVSSEIIAPATVTALPGNEGVVIAKAAGTITKIYRQLGDRVKEGEVLALVDSLEAASMTADRSTAQAKIELARKNYVRENSLYQQGVSPRQDMEAAQATLAVAQAEAKRTSIVMQAAHVAKDGHSIAVISPLTGKINTKTITLGAFVQPQSELFHIARPEGVQVEAFITVADIAHIKAGQPAAIITPDQSSISAIVYSITPTVNDKTHTATAIIKPVITQSQLIIGQGVQVRLQAQTPLLQGLMIPEEAVQTLDNHDVVFVRTRQGFRAQSVLIGNRSGGIAQIISGIKGYEQVATRNAFLIKAEINKNVKEEE